MRALLICLTFYSFAAFAAEGISFSFKNADLTEVLTSYSKASGQKMIFDPGMKGKITILNNEPVTVQEAFAQLSTALANNGYGISKQGDVMLVQTARSIQRNLIEVGSELPPLRPEQMFTWVINLKNISAEDLNRELRILSSKDGELVAVRHNNQVVVTDWVSNLYRIQKIVAEVDRPAAGGKKKNN